jgi:hypothetical protein
MQRKVREAQDIDTLKDIMLTMMQDHHEATIQAAAKERQMASEIECSRIEMQQLRQQQQQQQEQQEQQQQEQVAAVVDEFAEKLKIADRDFIEPNFHRLGFSASQFESYGLEPKLYDPYKPIRTIPMPPGEGAEGGAAGAGAAAAGAAAAGVGAGGAAGGAAGAGAADDEDEDEQETAADEEDFVFTAQPQPSAAKRAKRAKAKKPSPSHGKRRPRCVRMLRMPGPGMDTECHSAYAHPNGKIYCAEACHLPDHFMTYDPSISSSTFEAAHSAWLGSAMCGQCKDTAVAYGLSCYNKVGVLSHVPWRRCMCFFV